MKKRIHLKKRKRIKKTNSLLLVLILLVIAVVLLLNIINERIKPIIIEIATLEINKFSTLIVNKAINQVLEDKINTSEIFSTVTTNDGKIQTIDFNPVVVNQVLNLATTVVQDNLELLEEGKLDNIGVYDMQLSKKKIRKLRKGIITEIPFGAIFKNSVLANLGPKIPIRLNYLGDVNSNITTKITPYGINNALVEVGVHLEMTAQILLPFLTEKIKLDCDIPIAIKMIQGTVPNYYGSGLAKDSSIFSIPIE